MGMPSYWCSRTPTGQLLRCGDLRAPQPWTEVARLVETETVESGLVASTAGGVWVLRKRSKTGSQRLQAQEYGADGALLADFEVPGVEGMLLSNAVLALDGSLVVLAREGESCSSVLINPTDRTSTVQVAGPISSSANAPVLVALKDGRLVLLAVSESRPRHREGVLCGQQ